MCETVRVNLKVKLRPQEVGDDRHVEHIPRNATGHTQASPRKWSCGLEQQSHRDGTVQDSQSSQFTTTCPEHWTCSDRTQCFPCWVLILYFGLTSGYSPITIPSQETDSKKYINSNVYTMFPDLSSIFSIKNLYNKGITESRVIMSKFEGCPMHFRTTNSKSGKYSDFEAIGILLSRSDGWVNKKEGDTSEKSTSLCKIVTAQ